VRNGLMLGLAVLALGGACRSRSKQGGSRADAAPEETFGMRVWGGVTPPDALVIDGRSYALQPDPEHQWAYVPASLRDRAGQVVWHLPCGDRTLPFTSDGQYVVPDDDWIELRVDNRDGEATELAAGSYRRAVAAHGIDVLEFPRATCPDGAQLLLGGSPIADLSKPGVKQLFIDTTASHCYDVTEVFYGAAAPGRPERFPPLRKQRVHVTKYPIQIFPGPAPETRDYWGWSIVATPVPCR
jgi:hypothetical protein